MAISLGLLATLFGLYGIFIWNKEFCFILKGLLPLSLLCAGIIAILAGIHSFKKK